MFSGENNPRSGNNNWCNSSEWAHQRGRSHRGRWTGGSDRHPDQGTPDASAPAGTASEGLTPIQLPRTEVFGTLPGSLCFIDGHFLLKSAQHCLTSDLFLAFRVSMNITKKLLLPRAVRSLLRIWRRRWQGYHSTLPWKLMKLKSTRQDF